MTDITREFTESMFGNEAYKSEVGLLCWDFFRRKQQLIIKQHSEYYKPIAS